MGIFGAKGQCALVGLAASKAVLGSRGELDAFAGTTEGRSEWIRNKDILARSLEVLYQSKAAGYCFFSVSYLYDLQTWEIHPDIRQEYEAFAPLLHTKQ